MMEQLISDHLAEASTNGHTATMVADEESPIETPIHVAPPRPLALAADEHPAPAHHVVEADGQGDESNDDADDPAPREVAPAKPARVAPVVVQRVAAPSPAALGWVKGPDGVQAANRQGAKALIEKGKSAKAAAPAPRQEAEAEETRVSRSEAAHAGNKGGWAIQIGASEDADKANELLSRARARAPVLGSARAVTEKVKKGEGVFYRARFAGLDSTSAEQACRSLKRSGFPCFTAHD
jgi:D-alanyl-D-alanine carboxypeptidase